MLQRKGSIPPSPLPLGLSILLFALFFSLIGNTQTLPPKVTTFLPDQYDGHSQVFCLDTLPDGRTAFGTVQEVLVHNGEDFEKIDVGAGRAVFAMDADSTGKLFIGGESLMGMVVPDSSGTLTYRSILPLVPDSLKNFGVVWHIHCDPNGDVYFQSRNYIFRYDGDSVTSFHSEHEFYGLYTPADRAVTREPTKGLFRFKGADKDSLPGTKAFLWGKGLNSVLSAPSGSFGDWTMISRNKGLYEYQPETGKSEPIPDSGRKEVLKELRQAEMNMACRLDPKKNPHQAAYAIATEQDGIFLLDAQGRIKVHLNSETQLPADMIWDLVPDGRGNLWAATNNGIALLHTGKPFTRVEKGERFKGMVSHISRPDRSGAPQDTGRTPLFLTTSLGAWKCENGDCSFLEGTESQCFDLLPYAFEPEPRMLIAKNTDGLVSVPIWSKTEGANDVIKHSSITNIQALTKLPFPKNKGSVLVGGRHGLLVMGPTEDGEGIEERLHIEEVPEGVRSTGWDTSNSAQDSLRLWAGMASKGALSVVVDTSFTGYRVEHYDSAQGLPDEEVYIFPDPSSQGGEVLFGTYKGLYRFEEGRFQKESRYGSIFSDGSRQVYLFEEGPDGTIWINDNEGSQIKRVLPQKNGSYRIDSTVFRAMDIGDVRSILPEEDRIWFGADQGLACYFPDIGMGRERNWHCRFRAVRGNEDSLLFGGTFSKKANDNRKKLDSGSTPSTPIKEQPEGMMPVLPYSKNRMEFSFAAPFPTMQEAVQYSYRLRGFDTAWSAWTHEAKKEYTNLPEGDYNFKVKARNIYLDESSTAEYRFTILPPWYRTLWAYILYGATGGATLAIMGFLWVRKRKADQRAKEYLEGLEKANVEIREKKEEVERQKEQVEEAHHEITQSIDYAQKIQNALLQNEEHVSSHIPEHFIFFRPHSQVSGDFYWAREHKGYFYIAAVDCTGHGVPGAFMSMLGISQLNEIMNTDEVLTPGYILSDLRERVVRELSGSDPESAAKDGMDAAILRIANSNSNPNTNSKVERGSRRPARPEGNRSGGEAVGRDEVEVQFAGAQNPLYVIRKGIAEEGAFPEFETLEKLSEGTGKEGDYRFRPFKKSSDGIEIKGDPMPVGYDEYAKDAFTTVSLQLQKGDMLYVFSDGYADQFGGPKGKKFRYGPFKQLLARLHEKPLEEQKEELDRTFEDWKKEADHEQIDDVVVVGVRL